MKAQSGSLTNTLVEFWLICLMRGGKCVLFVRISLVEQIAGIEILSSWWSWCFAGRVLVWVSINLHWFRGILSFYIIYFLLLKPAETLEIHMILLIIIWSFSTLAKLHKVALLLANTPMLYWPPLRRRMKNTKRTWRHSYEQPGSWQVSHAISMLIKGLRAAKLKCVPKHDRCKEVAGFNASLHSIYIRGMLALLLSRAEGQMWCSPHLSPCGTSRLRFRTCKHSGNMNVKLCRSKRLGRRGKAKGAEHVAVASCMCSDTTGYSRCSRGLSATPSTLESL